MTEIVLAMTIIDPRSRRTSSANGSADESLFKALVENSTDTIFLIDLKTEECLYVSPAVRLLLGREPKSIVGRSLIEFVHPDHASEVLARSESRRRGQGAHTTVTRMLHREGKWIWVQATASPVLRFKGRSVAVFTATDAADRVRAEIGLRSAKQRLRHLLDKINAADDLPHNGDGSYDIVVEALAAALELRDDETGQHTRRVTDLALALTRAIDPQLALVPDLRYGFLLHDIGKIGVPDAILLKPGRLTEKERRVLQMHTTLGEHLLSNVPFVSDLAHDVVAYHHERWDGTGYPWGLSGTAIPLGARIFAVADAFDAITSDRPYRKARPMSEAIAEIRRWAGSQFDPAVAEKFVPLAGDLDPTSLGLRA